LVRLLIVEDSSLIRKLAQLAFPPPAYEIQEAANGLEGLTRLANARQPFDAIVLDLQMPDMNGVEFLRALQQRPHHRDTPVVIATSEGETSPLLAEARRLGVAAVVKKPWQPQAFAEVVKAAAADRRASGATTSAPARQPERLSDEDVRLLALAEHGHTYRPADVQRGDFEALVEHLRRLRERGLLRLDEGRIMRSQRGGYLMAGPCDLTEAGRQAIERDRRLGPRS
jgi:two-component system, chemotaxis family, chemotaxis protein CheY